MKLVTFVVDGREGVGSLRGERVVDLREARALQLLSRGLSVEEAADRARREIPERMVSFIRGGEETLATATQGEDFAVRNEGLGKATYPLRDVKLRAPIPEPPTILNMGNAYRPLEIGGFAFKPATSVIGPDEPIVIPREISDFGAVYECEIGVVMGRRGRRIPNDSTAYDHIYGYTVYNDVTDYGKQMSNLFDAKIHDTFCPMGPCIATRDEVKDPYSLTKRAWVNGQLATERSTREMLRRIPEFVSVASRMLTLLPGTVISTGAPDAGRLRPGDVIELEITKIGRLRNPVTSEK